MHPTCGPPVLVDDLIPIILGSDDHWWPRDFQRLALISPAWVGPVRKRLYAHPSLRSFHTCALFARTLLENPLLLTYLRCLDIRPVADDRRTLNEQEMQSLRYILGLKGLESVTLGGDLAVSAERFLHFMADTHTIKTLHIDGSAFLSGRVHSNVHDLPSLEWDDAIAVRFRSLRALTLTNVALTVNPPSLNLPGELSHLTLNNVDVVDGFLPDLFQGSWGSLRVLDVAGKPMAFMGDHVRSLLEVCENLEELNYEAVDLSSHPSVFEDEPPPFPSLQQLRMSGFDVSTRTLQAIAQSCPKLVDLSILGRVARLPHEEWASFIKSGALPCLQRLAIPAGTNKPPFAFWSSSEQSELQSACRSRNVDFTSKTPLDSSLSSD